MAIKHDRNGAVVVVNVDTTDILKPEATKDFMEFIRSQDEAFFTDIKWIAYNCSQVSTVAAMCFPVLCRLSSFLEQKNISLSLIGSTKITSIISKQGIERMIFPFADLETFNKHAGVSANSKQKNAKEFLNTTLESVASSMKIMLEATILSTEVKTINSADQMQNIQIGAIAGIVSTHFNGNLVIGFTNTDFKAAMSRFLQMEVIEITSEIKDGVAELLNVIIGQTKITLNDRGFDIQQVIPNVITGDNLSIYSTNKQKSILINYTCDFGKFCIILSTNV